MIKNIIFDIGNVLLNFQPEVYLKDKNIAPEKIGDIHNFVFKSDEWLMLDRGTITQAEAMRIISERNPDHKALIELAFENWYDMLTPIEETVLILKELKESGYKLYFLSNFHNLAFENVTSNYEFFKLFDGGVVSYKEKLIKPEPEIYETLLARFNLQAEESLFIDDMAYNIEAANQLLFKTILFVDAKNLKELLNDHLS